MKQKELVEGVAFGLVVGVVAGAVATLLLAPRSGPEMRRMLRYERDHTLDAARLQAGRAMARIRRAMPEEDVEEDYGAFIGA